MDSRGFGIASVRFQRFQQVYNKTDEGAGVKLHNISTAPMNVSNYDKRTRTWLLEIYFGHCLAHNAV